MNWRSEWKKLAAMLAVFVGCLYLPVESERFRGALVEGLALTRWYAREHVVLCLIPAFFIAGAIGVFVSQAAVMKYLGTRANQWLAYGVAAASGTVLAVCSCTVLPLFAGIYRMGAGLGPACAFLYSGPAINVLAIVLTARVLGPKLGLARAVGAIGFSILIGLAMHLLFRREEEAKAQAQMAQPPAPPAPRPLWQTTLYFASMVAVLVFANWAPPADGAGLWQLVFQAKWWLTAAGALALGAALVAWFGASWRQVGLVVAATGIAAVALPQHPVAAFVVGLIGLSWLTSRAPGEQGEWFGQSWDFAKQIMPLLLLGVLVAGLLLGRPGHEGLIPSEWVSAAVGGNSLRANLFAAVAGAFMYFATLTEVPIVQGLVTNGMGPGPALALLLAGPALSLPSMLVLAGVMGWKKTVVFVALVILMATSAGMIFGAVWA